MKYIVRTTPECNSWVEYLQGKIPGLIVCMDTTRNAMDTFLKAMEIAGDSPCVHLEDDILLTRRFTEKIEAIIGSEPEMVTNFFSMRKADLTDGTRLDYGRSFMSTLCFYLPAGMSKGVLDFYPNRDKKWVDPTGIDFLVADYLKNNRVKYKIHVPNLVQHRMVRSRINSKRSTKRQSLTFADMDD